MIFATLLGGTARCVLALRSLRFRPCLKGRRRGDVRRPDPCQRKWGRRAARMDTTANLPIDRREWYRRAIVVGAHQRGDCGRNRCLR
jgi:hypothetical protein